MIVPLQHVPGSHKTVLVVLLSVAMQRLYSEESRDAVLEARVVARFRQFLELGVDGLLDLVAHHVRGFQGCVLALGVVLRRIWHVQGVRVALLAQVALNENNLVRRDKDVPVLRHFTARDFDAVKGSNVGFETHIEAVWIELVQPVHDLPFFPVPVPFDCPFLRFIVRVCVGSQRTIFLGVVAVLVVVVAAGDLGKLRHQEIRVVGTLAHEDLV